MPATRLCLARHGETAWNTAGRVQGQTDIPLSEVGYAQARAVAEALKDERFAAIYSSDLLRVRQTADPAAARFSLPVRLDRGLRERHYGVFETLTYAEARARYPQDYARFKAGDPEFNFGNGESLKGFCERALGCVASLAGRHPGQHLLVFTHGGVLEMVYRRATGRGLSAPRDFKIPNAALNWISIDSDEWRVTAWAEDTHLEGALDDLP